MFNLCPTYPTPVGSPFGFTELDWEFIELERRPPNRLKVVFGHQFESETYDGKGLVENLRRSFEEAVKLYNQEPGHAEVSLLFVPLRAGLGEHIFNQIARDIISSDIAVFETSDFNPNVMIEMGVALTWGVRVLPIKAEGKEEPPSDISGQTWANYRDSASEFVGSEYPDRLHAMVRRALRRKRSSLR